MSEVLLIKSEEMVFQKMETNTGYASKCMLVTPEISNTVGAGIHTYDGCSMEWKTHYDQALVVLEGTLRILTGKNYGREIEAVFGDVMWFPKGTRLKYQGEKARAFSVVYPVDWRTRNEGEIPDATEEVIHVRGRDMLFQQMHIHSGGYASTCPVVGPATSRTLGCGIATYDGCSIDWRSHYDEALVVLGGNFRLLYGEECDRAIEGKRGDVCWIPKGARAKYQGERASIFWATFPVDWRTRLDPHSAISNAMTYATAVKPK
ncbi:hypothetical protein MTX26_27155 [Bradyrhizobium sp. ISRA443]|uniref:hypothetical protein n=1 Tax=unclassified Bradyrhizobium TaxID=2631580 RepID=UPI00247836C3|nr:MULTISPECIES: hypothetical protein [unclassified Bradyrhizobium]WGR93433.1 hypothetical protein MTX20_01970 [Bradyrhizobium sp. ISRA435]WGR97977.1 hypothetical protein MTX23_27150 [Bradyrhizobium sp. ISRA436]WGS04867.1 hypothetical protein MTX18_27160 [Bradyrhizobium sp. ISRA437]WGS11748.1 hypothetical protein MTX26_27155 [Bradyrhizobium sp. ISRA443]